MPGVTGFRIALSAIKFAVGGHVYPVDTRFAPDRYKKTLRKLRWRGRGANHCVSGKCAYFDGVEEERATAIGGLG
jgi:hypothetical protein